ncbi:MAG: hypothetical protein KAW14_10625, partial [Candidatus Aegiribacteria sp.]|nr:hypothetical protein [Candidatus Aegiribacteria sp.]
MAARQRQSARRRKTKKRKVNRLRNISVVLVLFLGVALAIILAIPATEYTKQIRKFLLGNLGYLSILLPLFLFQAGAWLLDLRMKKAGFRILSGIAVIGYFFTAVIDLVISRLSGGFHDIPGGSIAGGLGDILIPLTGAPIAFLILFTAFVASLVAFTGWDIGRDFQSLADSFLRLLGGMRKKRKKSKTIRSIEESGSSTSNAWSREQSEEEITDLPFLKEEIAVEPSLDKKPVPVSGKSRTPRRTDKHDLAGFVIPPISCLELPDERLRKRTSPQMMKEQGELLVEKLDDFGIECRIENSYPGPVITRFEVTPGPGIKVNRFVSLSDDLALALKARRIRILAPIPGKGAVGIEVPNPFPETVYLREIMDSISDQHLPIALGKKIEGEPFVADITTMPHLLIAGATGSGKSICMHSIIVSLLLTRTPAEVRLAMIDPKMLELSIYEGIPHLWAPVILETEKATLLLDALVSEMETRYKRLSRIGVRSITEFNARITTESEDERIPFIVVFIDELADLMFTVSREVEPAIARLAHMARAVGIHMVLATQRPSVDVITGVIKANFPSRIAFNVQSKTDSRTILDMNGAEKLLGKGDMLFLPTATPEPVRIHGSFITTEEIRTIVEHLRDQPKIPFEFEIPDDIGGNLMDPCAIKIDDPLFEKAKQIVIHTQQGSVSIIQRRLRVG